MTPQTMANQMPDFTGKLIDDGRFELVRLLGAGGGGVVYLATDHHAPTTSLDTSPSRCAIKIVRKLDEPHVDYQKREIAIHHLVSDIPHVLPMHDAWDDDQYLYIALEYCESDLYRAIFERRAYRGNDELVRSVFLQILDAVHGCHQREIFHRDLKPENILCNAEGSEAYIADFGLATSNKHSTTFCCGSFPYLSPESIGEEFSIQAYSTRRSDIWALGVVLVNMITGLCPWGKATSDDDRFCEYLLDDTYLERTLPASREIVQILKRVFRINPSSRPSLQQLRESILAVDSFFPPTQVSLGPRLPHATEKDTNRTPELPTTVDVDKESEKVSEKPTDSTSRVLYSEEGLHHSSLLSTAGASDPETMSTDDSAPATPPDHCATRQSSVELVERVGKALQSLTHAPESAVRIVELGILERLDIHVVV